MSDQRAVPTAERIEEIREGAYDNTRAVWTAREVRELVDALDASQARIAAVESDRQRDAYEAGERLYAAERRAEVAEARIVELEAERAHVLAQSNALSVASKGLRAWVVKFRGQIRAEIAEDVAQIKADIGEAERLVEQAETELGRATVAEGPERHVVDYEGEFAGCDGCEFCAPVATPEETE